MSFFNLVVYALFSMVILCVLVIEGTYILMSLGVHRRLVEQSKSTISS